MFRPTFWVGLLVVAAVAIGGITLYALESGEVVLVRTIDPGGGVHEARVWIVDDAGYSWVEAADAGKLFYKRILDYPDVEVVRGDAVHRHRALPVATDEAHARMRELLAEKYGWADRWVGLFVDTSQSIPVRLGPRPL